MNAKRSLIAFLLAIYLVTPTYLSRAQDEAELAPKPIEIEDVLSWTRISGTALSEDGLWFAYIVAPNEGDGDIFIKQIKGEVEYTFPIGASRGRIAFSEDGNYCAFTVSPTKKEADKLKQQKARSYNKAALVDLATGEKTEFEKVQQFEFSNENAAWLAMKKYQSESQGKDKEKWSGADLILYEMSSGQQLNIGNVSEFAFNKSGRILLWIVDSYGKVGNGILMRDMHSGVISSLESDEANYRSLSWTEEGDAVAVLKEKEDEDYEDSLFDVLGFYDFSSKGPKKVAFVPKEDDSFPEGMTVSPNRRPAWTEDLSAILFGIHEVKMKEKKDEEKETSDAEKDTTKNVIKKDEEPEKIKEDEKKEEKPIKEKEVKITDEDKADLVIWHWKDKRLQAMQQVQERRDKNFNYLCIYRVVEQKFIRLADDEIKNVTPAPKARWALGYDDQSYLLMSNLDGRRYQDVYVIDLLTGERSLALEKSRYTYGASPDGTHFLYYEDGHYYTYEMATDNTYNITENVPTSFVNEEDDHNVVKPPIRPIGWVKDGVSVLLFDNWDIWNVPVHGGNAKNLTVNGKETQVRYRSRYRLDPEEKGIDLSAPMYVSAYGEWTKKSGIGRIDKGKPGVKMLLWDDASFSSLMKAEEADVYLYTRSTHEEYPDYYVTDASLADGVKLTEGVPDQHKYLWSAGARLVDYTSDKGDRLQGALFLPANYEEGKRYPTIVYYYEKSSQRLHSYEAPRASGFNKTLYTSHGYAVFMPDIVYKVNDPGMSAVWCVLPAIDAAAATGVVDKERIGIHGHSWGGYQTAFLVTQSTLFKAAVAGAPLTNMISMYSSVYWNSGSANQPIFESSQGRFYGGYWDNLDAYTRNSPVYYAENVETPLIILHNDKDGAVDFNQGIEYYNTLRRLGKKVVMLQYVGENHGVRKPANQKDYTVRMKEFFDHFLMDKPAPEWWREGVPHLELEEHLEQRAKAIKGGKKIDEVEKAHAEKGGER